MRVHSVPLSRSLIKKFSSIGPCGTSLMTSVQLDFGPLITNLWAQLFSQLSVYLLVYISNPYFSSLLMRVLWEKVSKSLLKQS